MMHSIDVGWPPERYREAGTGFVVRELTARHLREAVYGEELHAHTWLSEVRRDLLMRRETVIDDVLRASAEWVHVGAHGGPTRAPRSLVDAFSIAEPPLGEAHPVTLPAWEPAPPEALPDFALTPWWTEMDPLAHVNHPRYLDWMDEALSVWLARRGADPVGLVPVAERIRYRTAAVAGDAVVVQGVRVGRVGDAAVFELEALREGRVLCEATLVRAHLAGPGALGLA